MCDNVYEYALTSPTQQKHQAAAQYYFRYDKWGGSLVIVVSYKHFHKNGPYNYKTPPEFANVKLPHVYFLQYYQWQKEMIQIF
jgi:hypothetical protein